MKKSTRYIIAAAVVACVVIAVFVVGKKPASGPGLAPTDALAQCLTAKGVKMYGAYWCSHCQNQKKAFGDVVPASTLVFVSRLARPELLIEVEAVAAKD